MTQVIDPKLYTNEELIKAYQQQKEACRELNKTILNNSLQSLPTVNECDNNKIAVVRKLNMVDTTQTSTAITTAATATSNNASIENLIDTKNTSTESLEEKAMNEKSEKEINNEKAMKDEIMKKKDDEVEMQEVKEVESINCSPTPSETNETDSLKMVQKTEIVLRVNPIMHETACQTDDTTDTFESIVMTNGEHEKLLLKTNSNSWNTPTRKIHPEEVDCENLSKDLASQLSPSDKLHNILGKHS
jgi:protein Shroom